MKKNRIIKETAIIITSHRSRSSQTGRQASKRLAEPCCFGNDERDVVFVEDDDDIASFRKLAGSGLRELDMVCYIRF